MAAKKNSSSSNSLMHYKHLISPSAGGVVAYVFSGVVMLGLLVFGAVWIGNMIGHHLHKNK